MAKIKELIQKEMTRKEFMSTIGFGLVSVLGFSSFLELLGKSSQHTSYRQVSVGYGSGSYGDPAKQKAKQ